jgi:hypothetical protein
LVALSRKMPVNSLAAVLSMVPPWEATVLLVTLAADRALLFAAQRYAAPW